MAARTAYAVRLPRALDAYGRWISPAPGATGFCPDCTGKVTAIVSDHYHNRFFRHTGRGGHHHGGSSGMSDEHRDAQAAMIDLFHNFDPRQEVHSSDRTRRADVMITYRGQRVVIEVQRSNMSLPDMEQRTRDWNDDGAAVFWVFTSSMLSIDSEGNAQLASTAYNWARVRGWRQCYIVDGDGGLWWIDLRPSPHVARPVRRRLRSRRDRAATLVVDVNTSGGRRPLIVGAFGWLDPSGRETSPLGADVPKWLKFHWDTTVDDTTPDQI